MLAVILANLPGFTATIKGDTALTAFRTSGNHSAIAGYYNAVPSSPIKIWRPNISVTEINTCIVGAEFVLLTALKQNLLNVLLLGPVDATSVNVQNNFTTIFIAGTQTLTNLTNVAQRPATRLEALFATNAVSSVFGYQLTAQDVSMALLNDDGSAK